VTEKSQNLLIFISKVCFGYETTLKLSLPVLTSGQSSREKSWHTWQGWTFYRQENVRAREI